MTVTIYLTLFTQANPKGAVKISGATPCIVHAESWGAMRTQTSELPGCAEPLYPLFHYRSHSF